MKILEQHLCFGVAVAVKFSIFLVGSENGGAGSANQWEGKYHWRYRGLQGVGDTCWSRKVVYSSGVGTQLPPAVVHPDQYHPPTTERSFQKRRSHHSSITHTRIQMRLQQRRWLGRIMPGYRSKIILQGKYTMKWREADAETKLI
jgi:hypothetical protein